MKKKGGVKSVGQQRQKQETKSPLRGEKHCFSSSLFSHEKSSSVLRSKSNFKFELNYIENY